MKFSTPADCRRVRKSLDMTPHAFSLFIGMGKNWCAQAECGKRKIGPLAQLRLEKVMNEKER